jgi:hypothetical protein
LGGKRAHGGAVVGEDVPSVAASWPDVVVGFDHVAGEAVGAEIGADGLDQVEFRDVTVKFF